MKITLAILTRIGQTVVTVFLLVTVVFFLLRVVGDPAELMVAPEASRDDIDALRARFGLDQPILVQYWHYLTGLVQFDFGMSMTQNRPAGQIVLEHVAPTLMLTTLSLLVGVPLALVLGVIAALRRGKFVDIVATALATLGRAMPNFWFGLMLIIVFSVTLGWFPASGYGTWAQLVLPTVALSVVVVADVTRLTRSSMIEASQQDYVRTAYAKGAGPARATVVHVLRNALIPVVTIVGLKTATLISGSIIIETIFAVPGLGWLLIRSINTFDFTLIQATVILIGLLVVITSLIVDVLYTLIDPRSRDVAKS
ncbi:ABC transporter permease [Microbacterium alcoholitolerans]|uniref:ABC transporter permease n=1 Tax=unclassified Microbacterium TaxID=2609290 RepID=UPI003D172E85